MTEPSIEDLLRIVVTQQQRIYDVLLVILANSNEEAYQNVVNAHKDFGNIGPHPFIMEE